MTLPSFDSTLRTRVVFGAGSLDRLGELAVSLGGHRVLLVTDAGIVRAGHAARAVSRLKAAGLEVTVFDAVREIRPPSMWLVALKWPAPLRWICSWAWAAAAPSIRPRA